MRNAAGFRGYTKVGPFLNQTVVKPIDQNRQGLANLTVEVSALARPRSPRLRYPGFRWLWLGLIIWSCGASAPAQLAITEVMSFASTNASGFSRPDFWELTNFGT